MNDLHHLIPLNVAPKQLYITRIYLCAGSDAYMYVYINKYIDIMYDHFIRSSLHRWYASTLVRLYYHALLHDAVFLTLHTMTICIGAGGLRESATEERGRREGCQIEVESNRGGERERSPRNFPHLRVREPRVFWLVSTVVLLRSRYIAWESLVVQRGAVTLARFAPKLVFQELRHEMKVPAGERVRILASLAILYLLARTYIFPPSLCLLSSAFSFYFSTHPTRCSQKGRKKRCCGEINEWSCNKNFQLSICFSL